MSIVDIEKELTESLAKEIQMTMDFEIIADILVRKGYTRIEIDYGTDKKWVDVMDWVDTTCTSIYQEHNGIWLFESKEDATIFKLKWV